MAVNPIPEGYHTVTPYLVVEGAAGLLDFLKQAFDAKEVFRMAGPNGTVAHAEVKIGNSMIMVGDAGAEHPATPGVICLYVENVDEVYQRAVAAGATSIKEVANQFYGDRSGGVKDPSGMQWWISTHIEDVAPEEMERRMAAAQGEHS
jgi:PhnB protein